MRLIRSLALSSALVLSPMLAGCAGQTPASVTTNLQTDVATLNVALQTIPGLLKSAGVVVPAAIQAQLNTALADISSNAAAIGVAVAASPASASAIVSDIATISAIVTPFFPQVGLVAPIVEAAVSLGSTLLSEAGVSLSYAKAQPPAKYTPAAARLILLGAAKS